MTFPPKRIAIILSLAAAGIAAIALTAATAPSTSVQFSTHLITDKLRGGYSVAIADVNHDGKLDIIPVAAGGSELAWYENPSWDRHVMLNDKRAMLWASAADIDGDGIPEFALLSDFGQDPKTSKGSVWLVKSQGDPKEMWKSYLVDAVPTAHRVTWADLEGNGKKEIVMAPVRRTEGLGRSEISRQRAAPLLARSRQAGRPMEARNRGRHAVRRRPSPARREMESGQARRFDDRRLRRHRSLHALRPRRQVEIRTQAARERRRAQGRAGRGRNDARHATTSIRIYIKGKRFLAAQEPWHGDEIVVYTNKGGQWQRNVIFKGLVQGHEMAVGDLNGDGRDDIVAVDVTNRGQPTPASVHIFYSEDDAGTQWRHELIDQGHDGRIGSSGRRYQWRRPSRHRCDQRQSR